MTDALGPVSRTLEAELRTWVGRHGVILWLDLDGHYGGFVQNHSSQGEGNQLSYKLLSFRGSHLELMLELEQLTGGIDRPRLVVHLPGFNEESVKETPLLELYAAGARFRRGLSTLVAEAAAGQVSPEEVNDFIQQPGLTLEQADAWLAARIRGEDDEMVGRLRAMDMPALMKDLLDRGELVGRLGWQGARDALRERMEAASGMPHSWFDDCVPPDSPGDEDYAFALASWALSVEYVDDLRRAPVARRLAGIRDLPRKTTDDCRDLALYLRTAHSGFYARTADETEARLHDEVDIARAEDLGQIDTFRFEDDKVLEASLEALAQAEYDEALTWANYRIDGGSFWLKQAPSRRSAWELCRDAAHLGLALQAAGEVLNARDLALALEFYQQRGAEVDLRHRHLEQQRATLLYAQLPEFELLRDMLDSMRQRWRGWADGWARDFNTLCCKEGFLPPAELQQRELFEQEVRPMCQEPGTTALFMVDALRFEMAFELLEAFEGTPATTVRLDARLAELPTDTDMGMNALAPVSQHGVLRLVMTSDNKISGISSGEFRVATPETRQRAMHMRVGGATCPLLTLDEVLEREATSLKQAVSRADLVLVHSREIDDAGEKGAGPGVFSQVLQKLRAAWRLLREAGVRRFVITADHGFLLLDPSSGKSQPHGRKIDPSRRHVFSRIAADHRGEVRVALSDLCYEEAGGYLMFPETTAVFDTGKRRRSFVHGGNSLQERVIPVLTLVHRAAAGGSTQRYMVEAEGMEGVAGMHCLSAKVSPTAQIGLDFGGVKELELDLGVAEGETLPGEVQVELCQTRGAARLAGGAVISRVGQRFELFFRLLGSANARVQVELRHSGAQADVIPATVDRRYPVAPDGRKAREDVARAGVGTRRWLEQLPEGGVRQVFDHIAAHGKVTEQEAAGMLGSPRALRRFALRFEKYAAAAPFSVHIEVAGGVKRYVRQGSES